MDRSKVIFGNEMKNSVYRKAVKSKRKYIKKFGDDSQADYPVEIRKNEHIGELLGVYDVCLPEGKTAANAAKTGGTADPGGDALSCGGVRAARLRVQLNGDDKGGAFGDPGGNCAIQAVA